MPQLPHNKHLPIDRLACCFNNTSATYKFYWLLAIIESLESRIESGSTLIAKRELFTRMICNAWYPVNYFHISFGKWDNIQSAIERIRVSENLTLDIDKAKLLNVLLNTGNRNTISVLNYLDKNVPHWFLSPWFPSDNKQTIYYKSQNSGFFCPYSLHKEHISVDLLWANYLLLNASFIKDYCYWNLVVFLQIKNPNVPDIANKLIKPAIRNSLNKQRKFWNIVMNELNTFECIYTNKKLSKGNFAIDHFVPYNFVSHDLNWNLIPTDISFNSIKSDKLPTHKYFAPFCHLQEKAIKIVLEKEPRNKILEDYLTIFSDINEIKNDHSIEKFKDTIQPFIKIAANNGFEYLRQ